VLFWLLIGIVALIMLLVSMASRRPSSAKTPFENPNANNPDALEADLDPEGDEPEGY
jgi:hypothetical protein